MKFNALLKWLIIVIVIIIILGGTIIVVIVRPVPDPPPCLVCGLNSLKYLGIAEVILGIVSLGLINKIRNTQRF
jgi:hypothetical protein